MESSKRSATASWHLFWWQLAAFLAVTSLAVYVTSSFHEELSKFLPETKSFRSTFNKLPSGYSGLLALAKKSGLPCRIWQSPYRQLSEARGMLLIVSPLESLPTFEIDQILSWVAKGNDLVYLDNFEFLFERKLTSRLGLEARDELYLDDAPITSKLDRPELAHVSRLSITASTRLRGGKPVVEDESGAILTEVKHGDGRILVGVAPSLCANRLLSSRDNWGNFQFMVNWFRTARGEIIFDEFCHGYSSVKNVFAFLARGPLGLIFLQLLILLLVATASACQRFGAPQAADPQRTISNIEFINGLASTYRRARARDLIWEMLSHAFRTKLSRSLAVSPHEPDQKLIEAWSLATGAGSKELESLLATSAEKLEGRHISDEELLELVAACDKISESLRDLFATDKAKPT